MKEVTVNEAGRQGGLAVLKSRGKEFFIRIGSLGQASMRQKYPDKAREWGKLGGRPKKPALNTILGEEGK